MRPTDLTTIGTLLLTALPVPGKSGHAEGPNRPNVVLMIADDLARDDCGAFGNPRVKTPNIDRLARGGMRFDRAFVTASSCSPSRSSLITGCYPHNTDTKIHGVPPAEADMQRYFRVSAPAVHEMVKTLERQGFIAREPGRPRSIRRLLSRAGLPDLG